MVFDVFTSDKCKRAFKKAGQVPLNARRVIDPLDVRLQTPPKPLQSETPSHTYEFGPQSNRVGERFAEPTGSGQEHPSPFIALATSMEEKNKSQAAIITQLKKQLAEATKKRGHYRKRIQTGSRTKLGTGALQVANRAPTTRKTSNKLRNGKSREMTHPAQRGCRICRQKGHYASTCPIEKNRI